MLKIKEKIATGMIRIWEVNKLLWSGDTPFQNLIICETEQGISLFCNNERQSTELTQLIYHEGMIIPALLLAKNIEKVMIIGSSEGVITKIAQEAGAKIIQHVDIDEECVKLCAKYLPYGYTQEEVEWYSTGKDPCVSLIFEDGYKIVQNASAKREKYDIIALDLPDEEIESYQQHNRLYSLEFLENVRSILTNDGVFISQGGCSTFWRNSTLKSLHSKFESVFQKTIYFEMEEQNWSFLIGMKQNVNQIEKLMQQNLRQLLYKPRHIDERSIIKSTVEPISLRVSCNSSAK